jgi:hypothetical protein
MQFVGVGDRKISLALKALLGINSSNLLYREKRINSIN